MTDKHQEPAPPEKLLVISAHPDDIEFVVAGTVAKWVRSGTKARYVVVTSGDAGTHRMDVDRETLARIREAEQTAAARVVGVETVVYLRYPDGMVEPTLELRRELVREIRRFKPHTVICYDPTRLYSRGSYINHPDHRAVAQAALDAISPTAAMPLSFPEQIAEGLEPHRVRQILVAAPTQADTWIDISETLDLKLEALKKHDSQHDGRRDLHALIHGWAEQAGTEAGLRYAEAFRRILRPEGLD
jgi:LmbE family N-acetylglucosaminyl deacetylase